MDKKKSKYDVDIPKEVLDAFARYIIPEIRRFHESEEGQAFYKEWLEKHPEYAEKLKSPLGSWCPQRTFSAYDITRAIPSQQNHR